MSTRTWLESIGCGKYADAFEENEITPELLGDLDDGDLRELGLTIGDRKRFRRALGDRGRSSAPSAPVAAAAEPEPHAASPHLERRRLTVMFVDLVGSTSLSARLDPEDWGAVLREYQNIAAGLVTRLGGHVAKYLGDGVLCFFGWPKAMEDAAERAAETALEIIQGVGRIRTGSDALACRIGIATGPVVVGDLMARGETGEESAVGEVLDFADQLQSAAGRNQVVVSASTRRLLGNAFVLELLGERALKGVPEPQPVFAITGRNPEHDRFAAREEHTIGAVVGRESELSALRDRWFMAREGEGQVVKLAGDAGIGKSRICRAFVDGLADEPCVRIRYQCSPYLRDTALWPVINQLVASSGIRAEDPAEERLDKLERLLHRDGTVDERECALIADLLGLDAEARYGPIDLAPSARRATIFSILSSQLVAQSRREPVLLLLEDAHWADPTTLELLGHIIAALERERIMLLITTRTDGHLVLPNRACVTSIVIDRLGRKGAAAIIERLSAGRLAPETVEAIIERTDGVPLFIEELTKAMLESGEMSVPASLHDTLMARLDRLPEAKEVAQVASVFGRDFEAGPVAAVAELSQQRVIEALDKLRKVELVYARLRGRQRFSFNHALVRDAAYESLLNRRRQEIHGRILDVLSKDESTMPGVLAQHAAEARRIEEAVHYGRLAAEQALRRPAYPEAMKQLDTALGLLDELEENEATLAERKRLLLLSAQARIAHVGYAVEPTVRTFAEIERLARRTGDSELLIDALYGRWTGQCVPGRFPLALETAETFCQVADEVGGTLSRALGPRLRGTVLTMMGRVREASEALAEAERLYDPVLHPGQASRFGQDTGVAAKCYRVGVLAVSGRFDAASALAREVLEDLERIDHAHTNGYALGKLAVFLCSAEIVPLGIEVAQRCIEVSERDRMPLWAALGHASVATAHAHEGSIEIAAADLGAALDRMGELKFAAFRPVLLPVYATALARTGDLPAALDRLAEARRLMEEDDARYSEPELHAAEGLVLQLRGDLPEAETRFRQALARARDLGHLSWEIRTAERLAGLMREAGRAEEGRELLASALNRTEEGQGLPLLRRVIGALGEFV